LVDALEELKRLLANATGWQHWCGVSEAADPAAEAAEHIFLVDAGPPTEGNERGGYSRGDLEAIRPAAFIDFPPPELQDDEVFMAPRIGSGFHAHYGRLNIAIDDDVPAELE